MENSEPLAQLQHINREHMHELWRMRDQGVSELSADQSRLLEAMREHPEFYPLWERLPYLPKGEFLVGEMNPFVHVVMHAIVENQYGASDPPEVVAALDSLVKAGFTRHRAVHAIGNVFTVELFDVLQSRSPFNPLRYQGRLKLMGQGATKPGSLEAIARTTGRNDRCPCGSGRKFKQCCIDWLPPDLDPNHWHFLLPGGEIYILPEFAKTAPDDQPARLLNNLSAVANALAAAGDFEGVFATYRSMEEIAKTQEFEGLWYNVLQDAVFFGLNHPEFAARVLEFSQTLLDRSTSDEEGIMVRVSVLLDHADLLTYAGHVDEGKALYGKAQDLAAAYSDNQELQELLHGRRGDWSTHVQHWAKRR